MSVTNAQVADFLNLDVSNPRVPQLIEQAVTLISDRLGLRGMQRIPDDVFDYAIIQTCGELQRAYQAPGANLQWGPDGTAVYGDRDVLARVMPQIRKYKGTGALG